MQGYPHVRVTRVSLLKINSHTRMTLTWVHAGIAGIAGISSLLRILLLLTSTGHSAYDRTVGKLRRGVGDPQSSHPPPRAPGTWRATDGGRGSRVVRRSRSALS